MTKEESSAVLEKNFVEIQGKCKKHFPEIQLRITMKILGFQTFSASLTLFGLGLFLNLKSRGGGGGGKMAPLLTWLFQAK